MLALEDPTQIISTRISTDRIRRTLIPPESGWRNEDKEEEPIMHMRTQIGTVGPMQVTCHYSESRTCAVEIGMTVDRHDLLAVAEGLQEQGTFVVMLTPDQTRALAKLLEQAADEVECSSPFCPEPVSKSGKLE